MRKWWQTLVISVCILLGLLPVTACENTPNVHTRYEIILEYAPEHGTLAGAEKITFENHTQNELSVLKFQLYPNAYRKDALYRPVSKTVENSAYYAGESYGEIVISSVNGAKNWEVMGEDENILYVYLMNSLFPGEQVVLDIGYVVKLAKVNHRTGITPQTVNLGNCYPILCGYKDGGFVETVYYSDGDPFFGDCADYQITLTAPKEYVLIGTGETVEERTLESKKRHTVSALNVRDVAFLLSTKYRIAEKKCGDTLLQYAYYQDNEPEKTLQMVEEIFSFYEKTFGKYLQATYAVAQTGLCQGGMSYSGLTMLSDEVDAEERVRALAHETAHQWWGVTVGNDPIENAWQDEGLAEYSACLFFENYEKYALTRESLVKEALLEYRSYYDVYGSVLGRTDTKMTKHLKDFISDYEYKCLAYDKSVVMFDTLRKSVGEEKFETGLKKYYAENKFSIALPDALIGAFERVGLDVRGFFESFLDGKAVL